MKVLVVLLPLLLLQDKGQVWNRPVEILRSDMSIHPVSLRFDDTSIQGWVFESGGPDSWALRSISSADGGRTWKKGDGFDFKEGSVLAYLVREGRVEALVESEEGDLSFLAGDLKTGKELFQVKFAPKGVESAGDISEAEILLHGGELFLLCADEAESDAEESQLRVYNSKDGGKSWALSTGEKWLHHSVTPTNPLLFEAGGALHVVYSREDDGSEIGHFASSDKGATWKKEPKLVFKDMAARPLAIAVNGAKLAMFVSVQIGEEDDDGSVQAWLSPDGGATWAPGGKVYDTALDDLWSDVRVCMNGDSLLFLGHKGTGEDSTGIACLSRDGGKTWKDLDFTQGLNRISNLPEGAFSKDGNSIHLLFLNQEEHDGETDSHAHVILWRRWGVPAPAVPLTDAEQKQIREWLADPGDAAGEKIVGFRERALPLIDQALTAAADPKVKERLTALRNKINPEWLK